MENIDSSKQQYIVFSVIVAIIISFIINFYAIELMKNSALYGVPFKLEELTGVANFGARVGNSVFMGLFISPITYFTLMWLNNKRGGL